MSRPLTVDEVREEFLNHARSVARYWAGLDGSNVPEEYTSIQRTMGAVFSVLSAIDGCSMEIPGFKLIPNPHPDDMQYAISEHEDYFPSDGDIAGCLHELFHKPEDVELPGYVLPPGTTPEDILARDEEILSQENSE